MFFKRLIPDPFVLGLLATLALSSFFPATNGFAVAVGWLAKLAIVILFFFLGAKLSRKAVIDGISHWRLHLTIFGSTFIIFPLVGLVFSLLFPGLLPPVLWVGVLYLAALPSTVQSSIAFTSIAGGNVSAAIAAASASQVIGVFLSPLLTGLLVGAQGGSLPISGLGKIMLLILVPFIVGHLLRPLIADWVARNKGVISITDRATILLAVYSAFSAAVIDGIWSRLPMSTLLMLLLICSIILSIMLFTTHRLAKLFAFNKADSICIVFCGTKKSLVQGVPMASILFAGPDLGMILLPAMIFHQIQLMVCAYIARHYSLEEKESE